MPYSLASKTGVMLSSRDVRASVPKYMVSAPKNTFWRKSCLQTGHEFSIGGEVIPVVAKYKYLGCVIDEFLDLNAMVDDRVEAGRRALGSLLRGAQSTVGVLFGRTFKKLLDAMV